MLGRDAFDRKRGGCDDRVDGGIVTLGLRPAQFQAPAFALEVYFDVRYFGKPEICRLQYGR